MRREPPAWWYRPEPTLAAKLCAPLAMAYDAAGAWRQRATTPFRCPLPVICVGNFTVGGAGKTPLTIAIADELTQLGHQPGFLTRGYGGRERGPVWIKASDAAADVGDEPLLLARHGPALLARDRVAGARAMTTAGAASTVDSIIMDDGMQNPSLVKDLRIAVVDGATGIGNGLVMPAGPLRMTMQRQRSLADAVVVIGPLTQRVATFLRSFTQPVLHAEIVSAGDTAWLHGTRVVAFAGIGRPQKLFDTVAAQGAVLVAGVPFPDHHSFSASDCTALLRHADAMDAQLVTTEKDWLRLPDQGPASDLKRASRPLPVKLRFQPDHRDQLVTLLRAALFGQRLQRSP